MAFTASNVYFKTTNAYLSQDDWVTQAGLHSQHGTDEPTILYENEFAINPFTNLVLSNKYGELLIRQKIDDDDYVYYVIIFDNHDCHPCNQSYLGYSHSDFSESLEYILDKYFNLDDNDNLNIQDSTTTPRGENETPAFHFTSDVSVIPSIDIFNNNYSKKYNILVNSDEIPIQTKDGCYISRINKENGRHRYYLTRVSSELETDDICYKPATRFYIFKSRYIGTNMNDVLKQYVYTP
jgi:hypothetical protein